MNASPPEILLECSRPHPVGGRQSRIAVTHALLHIQNHRATASLARPALETLPIDGTPIELLGGRGTGGGLDRPGAAAPVETTPATVPGASDRAARSVATVVNTGDIARSPVVPSIPSASRSPGRFPANSGISTSRSRSSERLNQAPLALFKTSRTSPHTRFSARQGGFMPSSCRVSVLNPDSPRSSPTARTRDRRLAGFSVIPPGLQNSTIAEPWEPHANPPQSGAKPSPFLP